MWREVSWLVDRDQADAWSDAALAAGAMSVTAEDADADSADEQAQFGEPGSPVATYGWRRTRLAALIDGERTAADLLGEASRILECPAPPEFRERTFADQDWVHATQAQFAPIEIGRRLRITPSWHMSTTTTPRSPDDDTRLTLVLDPGMAFGTGTHPTTRLCLAWLDRHLTAGARVIDYGCGSGILAIAAVRLGAGEVTAIDIDPQALAATRSNAEINRIDAAHLSVRDTRAALPAPADIVVANILASPLKVLAPMLTPLVAPGGALVLSGLLERQVEEVAACYPRFQLSAWAIEDGWACLAGRHAT